MFVILKNTTIINVEEISYTKTGSGATLWIHFKNPTTPTDYVMLDYKNRQELQEDLNKLIQACEEYNNIKMKNK